MEKILTLIFICLYLRSAGDSQYSVIPLILVYLIIRDIAADPPKMYTDGLTDSWIDVLSCARGLISVMFCPSWAASLRTRTESILLVSILSKSISFYLFLMILKCASSQIYRQQNQGFRFDKRK